MPPADENWGLTLEKYRERLRREAARAGGGIPGSADVSDVVQGVFCQAVANHDQYQGETEGELWGWLRTILRNLIIDLKRRRQRSRRGNEQSLDHGSDPPSARAKVEPLSDGTSPSQKCVKEEESSRIHNAMEELPESQQTALRLRDMEGLKVAEVAEQMGRSPKEVASLLHRARKALRKKMS